MGSQPHGMARALSTTVLALVVVTVIALLAGLGAPASGPGEILFLNAFFVGCLSDWPGYF
ncbi:MAG: hypothetical protein ACYTHJ_14160 [Planctomycetota bacterium]